MLRNDTHVTGLINGTTLEALAGRAAVTSELIRPRRSLTQAAKHVRTHAAKHNQAELTKFVKHPAMVKLRELFKATQPYSPPNLGPRPPAVKTIDADAHSALLALNSLEVTERIDAAIYYALPDSLEVLRLVSDTLGEERRR